MTRTPYDAPVDREIEQWPGVSVRRTSGGKHMRLWVSFNGTERFIAYPCTPSDGARGLKNHLGELRMLLRDMGAVRAMPAQSERASKRDDGITRTVFRFEDRPVARLDCDPWEKLRELLA